MANYQICRRYLTAFKTGKLRITCYWIQGKPSRDMWTLLSRTFYEYVTRVWRGYPSLLGEWKQDNLCWNYQVEQTVKKAMNRLYYLRECRKENLPTETRGITIYSTKILPLEYASPVWGSLPITLQKSCGLYKSGAYILSGYQEHPFQR